MRAILFSIIEAVLLMASLLFAMPVFAAERPDLVEIIEITGVINSFGVSQVSKQVDQINDNKAVKAVVVVMNSPGGGVVASAVLREELGRLKTPVVGWCDYVCASGGMYALSAPTVQYIGARTETIAGSIGVIMHLMRFNRLLDFLKVDSETYASGSLKNAGDSTKAKTEAEAAYLNAIVSQLAERFYQVIDAARGAKVKNWDEIKTGKVFIGESAVAIGLIDRIMSREDAIAKAKSLSGSKLIFTRDELRKMSKQAEEQAAYSAPPLPFGDVPWLINQMKEIRAGEVISFSYLMPLKF